MTHLQCFLNELGKTRGMHSIMLPVLTLYFVEDGKIINPLDCHNIVMQSSGLIGHLADTIFKVRICHVNRAYI